VSLWRRFRSLRSEVQAGVWLGIVCIYTAGLVLLLGGGGGSDDAKTPAETRADWSPTERRVATAVERNPVKVKERNDVARFRKPSVRRVECEDGGCLVEYGTGVPGNGRIREDQQQMLARLFRDPSLDRLTLRVVRAAPRALGVALKPDEESPPGLFLLETTCRRTEQTTQLDDPDVELPPIPATCETRINSAIGKAQRNAGRQNPANPSSEAGGNGAEGLLEGGP
jgi:hypothetical protein